MLVSTHEDGCATRAAARCPALSDSSTWMPGMRVFDCHTVICYTKSSGNQNLTAVPALLGLQGILQSATCDNSAPAALQRTPPEVSASDSHLHDSAPVGWLRGEGKAALLKNLTARPACQWQGPILARHWLCSHLRASCQRSASGLLNDAPHYQLTHAI